MDGTYKFTIIIQEAHSFSYLVQPPCIILISATCHKSKQTKYHKLIDTRTF